MSVSSRQVCSVIQWLTSWYSLFGGATMVVVGISYLLFEDFVLGDFGQTKKAPLSRNHVSRTLVGIQIGLTILAMVITRSSALSLQAKQGLPLGNQVLGWVVLGMSSKNAMLGDD